MVVFAVNAVYGMLAMLRERERERENSESTIKLLGFEPKTF